MRRTVSFVLLFVAIFLLVACSESPTTTASNESKPTSESPGPSGPVTGKTAYWATYKSAYAWSNDVVGLRLESKSISGIKNEAGNAALWTATFGSPSKHEAIEISYAVASQLPDIVKGVNVGHAIPWSGPTRDVMPIDGSDIAVDSDAAYKTAATHADAWLKAHPDKPVSFLMGNNPATFAAPVWYVLWGDKKDGYNVYVNCKTGELAKRVK